MILLDNRSDADVEIDSLQEIADSLTDRDIELIITHSKEMREINKEYRGKDRATDVLSFPLTDVEGFPLGSIVINIDLAKDAAKSEGHTLRDEIKILFIHGLLHLKGFDHESDEGEMRELERELALKFNLPNSLTTRGE
jgi:probable rRNA maturation factor